MGWLAIGARVAKAVIAGVNFVEDVKTVSKGDDKREMALRFARESLEMCAETAATHLTEKVKDALRDYNDAYVKLQNALAGK